MDGVDKDHSGEFCHQFNRDNGPLWSSYLLRYKLLFLFPIKAQHDASWV